MIAYKPHIMPKCFSYFHFQNDNIMEEIMFFAKKICGKNLGQDQADGGIQVDWTLRRRKGFWVCDWPNYTGVHG